MGVASSRGHRAGLKMPRDKLPLEVDERNQRREALRFAAG